MSWMSARDAQREKLEGSLLTVCVDCKEMVVQVRQLILLVWIGFWRLSFLIVGHSCIEELQEKFSGGIFKHLTRYCQRNAIVKKNDNVFCDNDFLFKMID